MSEVLDGLLYAIRMHPGRKELLERLRPADLPRFKKGKDLQTLGAEFVYASGQRDQYERVLAVLTGSSQEMNSDEETL